MTLSRAMPAGANTNIRICVDVAATVSTVQPGAEQASVIARSQKRAVAGIFSNARLLYMEQTTWYHWFRADGLA